MVVLRVVPDLTVHCMVDLLVIRVVLGELTHHFMVLQMVKAGEELLEFRDRTPTVQYAVHIGEDRKVTQCWELHMWDTDMVLVFPTLDGIVVIGDWQSEQVLNMWVRLLRM